MKTQNIVTAVMAVGMMGATLARASENPSWTYKADMPTARSGLCVSMVDGKIYAIGGGVWQQSLLSTVEAYDPVSDTWTTKAPIPTARVFFSTCVLDGKIFAIGGCPDPYNSSELSTVEAYDPTTDTWTRMMYMQVRRKALASASVNGKIYAIGGQPVAGWDAPLSTVEEYDPRPAVSMGCERGRVSLWWNGVLQSANAVAGSTWEDLNPAPRACPWVFIPGQTGYVQFYRAREP